MGNFLHKNKTEMNIPLRIAAVLMCLTLLSTSMVAGLFARYATSGQSSDSTGVAAFVFETRDEVTDRSLDLSGIQMPGDIRSYRFIISNHNAGATSEVAERIRFTVQLNGSMPLECTITKDGAAAPVLTAKVTEGRDMSTSVTAESGAIVFPAAAEHTETYILTATWPEEANGVEYANRSAAAELQLTVTAEQID